VRADQGQFRQRAADALAVSGRGRGAALAGPRIDDDFEILAPQVAAQQECGASTRALVAGGARDLGHRGGHAHLVLLRKAEQFRDLARALAHHDHVLVAVQGHVEDAVQVHVSSRAGARPAPWRRRGGG
jgi:hypothetical protein